MFSDMEPVVQALVAAATAFLTAATTLVTMILARWVLQIANVNSHEKKEAGQPRKD